MIIAGRFYDDIEYQDLREHFGYKIAEEIERIEIRLEYKMDLTIDPRMLMGNMVSRTLLKAANVAKGDRSWVG